MSESLKSLHKKYSDYYKDDSICENVAKLDKLFEEMSDDFLQEQFVPPEPESVIKFYKELYEKYGEVDDSGNKRQENS